jgi:hypothetical protein
MFDILRAKRLKCYILNMNKSILLLVFVAFFGLSVTPMPTQAAPLKTVDGIITQINLQDGELLIRDRNGSPMTIKLPFKINANISVKGVLDDIKNIFDGVIEIKVKNATATDAIPIISHIYPGSGAAGTKITITGTGFTKKNNSVFIDSIPYASVGIPSKNGLTISFGLPIAPCDQRQKKCVGEDMKLGRHELLVANSNGRSNVVPFNLIPSPALSLITDSLPQVVAKTAYNAKISATGGARSYIWRISEGKLPGGIRVVQSFCSELVCRGDFTLAGIPTMPGKYDFKVSLTSGSENITKAFSIVVVQPINAPQY